MTSVPGAVKKTRLRGTTTCRCTIIGCSGTNEGCTMSGPCGKSGRATTTGGAPKNGRATMTDCPTNGRVTTTWRWRANGRATTTGRPRIRAARALSPANAAGGAARAASVASAMSDAMIFMSGSRCNDAMATAVGESGPAAVVKNLLDDDHQSLAGEEHAVARHDDLLLHDAGLRDHERLADDDRLRRGEGLRDGKGARDEERLRQSERPADGQRHHGRADDDDRGLRPDRPRRDDIAAGDLDGAARDSAGRRHGHGQRRDRDQ